MRCAWHSIQSVKQDCQPQAATLRLFFGTFSSSLPSLSSWSCLAAGLLARDLGFALALAARRVLLGLALGCASEDLALAGVVLVDAFRFVLPRTLPVTLAVPSRSIRLSSALASPSSSVVSTSLRLRVRLWRTPRVARGSWERMPSQFFRRHETSLSCWGVESARNRARLTSVCRPHQRSVETLPDRTYRVFPFVAPPIRWALIPISFDGLPAALPKRLVLRTFPSSRPTHALDQRALVVMGYETAPIVVLDVHILLVATDAV
jgi:hypothetical protein